jgi:hexosaminidase
VPGHSRGFVPIAGPAPGQVQFCTSDATQNQLYGDPANQTLNTLESLFSELAPLFPDPIWHIGADETNVVGPCTLQSTFTMERAILSYISSLGKTPAGWEEVLFDAGAATNATIVYAWSRHSPGEVTAQGRQVVSSNGSHFYFTEAVPGGPAGWSVCWLDISETVPAQQQSLVLGGESSMWTGEASPIPRAWVGGGGACARGCV